MSNPDEAKLSLESQSPQGYYWIKTMGKALRKNWARKWGTPNSTAYYRFLLSCSPLTFEQNGPFNSIHNSSSLLPKTGTWPWNCWILGCRSFMPLGGTPKWRVYKWENPMKIDDLGIFRGSPHVWKPLYFAWTFWEPRDFPRLFDQHRSTSIDINRQRSALFFSPSTNIMFVIKEHVCFFLFVS